MSNQFKATAKDVELKKDAERKKDVGAKIESAYGDLTGDRGRQMKGKTKQVPAWAAHGLRETAAAGSARQHGEP